MPIESTSSDSREYAAAQRSAPLAQAAKTRASLGLGNAPWSNGHQPAHLQILKIRQPLQQFASFTRVRLQSGLGLLGAELHLDQNRQPLA